MTANLKVDFKAQIIQFLQNIDEISSENKALLSQRLLAERIPSNQIGRHKICLFLAGLFAHPHHQYLLTEKNHQAIFTLVEKLGFSLKEEAKVRSKPSSNR